MTINAVIKIKKKNMVYGIQYTEHNKKQKHNRLPKSFGTECEVARINSKIIGTSFYLILGRNL
jgi:hypothetical protein